VDPSIVATVLGIAALGGDAQLMETFRRRFESAASPAERNRFLEAIASFRDPVLLGAALDWALHAVRATDLATFRTGMSETEAGRQQYFEFTRDHFDELAAKFSSDFVANFGSAGGGCSPERLAAAEAFFGDPARAVPGTELTLERTRNSVTDCVSLREREGEAVRRYLRRFARPERAGN
jgi:hypothetical protein